MATVQNTCPVFEDWTAPAIVQHINRHGLTLGDAQRAWTVLGYKTPNGAAYAKPSPDGFQTRIVNLWNFLLRHADDRVGRRARLYILEALKSLRYYRRWWTVDSPLDQINQSYDMGIFWHTQLEPPLGNVTVSKWEAARDCVLYPPLSSFNMPWMIAYAREEPADATIEEDEIWHKFHPFRKGFVARDHRGIEHRFRAMPEPDPDSLWCSISSNISTHSWSPEKDARFIWGFDPAAAAAATAAGTAAKGAKVPAPPERKLPVITQSHVHKAKIWSYFNQVLLHSSHVRWRDYMWLNHITARQDPIYGEISILRHLYCNERIHGPLGTVTGSPVLEPPKEILHVIADYYGIEVVVFRYHPPDPPTPGSPGPPVEGEEERVSHHGISSKSAWHHPIYSVETFGPRTDFRRGGRQILLTTTDYRHFDSVVHVKTQGKPRYFVTDQACRVKFPSPWWQPGFQRARNAVLDRLPIAPCRVPHFSHPGDSRVLRDAVLWDDAGEFELTHEHIFGYFRNHRDLPGLNFRGLPTREYMETWDDPVEDAYVWTIGREPYGQIRWGGMDLKVLANPSESEEGGLGLFSILNAFHREFPLNRRNQPVRSIAAAATAPGPGGGDGRGDGGRDDDARDDETQRRDQGRGRGRDIAAETTARLQELSRFDDESEEETRTGSGSGTTRTLRQEARAEAEEWLERHSPEDLQRRRNQGKTPTRRATRRAAPPGGGAEQEAAESPAKRAAPTPTPQGSDVERETPAAKRPRTAARQAREEEKEIDLQEEESQLLAIQLQYEGEDIPEEVMGQLPQAAQEHLQRLKEREETEAGFALLESLQQQYHGRKIPARELARLPRLIRDGLKASLRVGGGRLRGG